MNNKPFSWTCPHCQSKTTVNENDYVEQESQMKLESSDGYKTAFTMWIVCPSVECKKITLCIQLYDLYYVPKMYRLGDFERQWVLIPDNNGKVYPSYIPKALRQDYEEAYSILELSPKASATLSRRCLEGMIGDFWNVRKGRLIDSINAIKDKVDPLTWEAIDSTRKVGNIGAHMEKDINLIIEVDPNEAKLLIGLIEMLFEEWYIHRYEREQKLNAIVAISEDKASARKKD